MIYFLIQLLLLIHRFRSFNAVKNKLLSWLNSSCCLDCWTTDINVERLLKTQKTESENSWSDLVHGTEGGFQPPHVPVMLFISVHVIRTRDSFKHSTYSEKHTKQMKSYLCTIWTNVCASSQKPSRRVEHKASSSILIPIVLECKHTDVLRCPHGFGHMVKIIHHPCDSGPALMFVHCVVNQSWGDSQTCYSFSFSWQKQISQMISQMNTIFWYNTCPAILRTPLAIFL